MSEIGFVNNAKKHAKEFYASMQVHSQIRKMKVGNTILFASPNRYVVLECKKVMNSEEFRKKYNPTTGVKADSVCIDEFKNIENPELTGGEG